MESIQAVPVVSLKDILAIEDLMALGLSMGVGECASMDVWINLEDDEGEE